MSNEGREQRAFLHEQTWNPVTVHAMNLAFLRAEWTRWATFTRWINPELIQAPRLDDHGENQLRTCLLYGLRGRLLRHVPHDTQWHLVRWLRIEHLHQLHVIGRCGWDDPRDCNELLQVASRRPHPLQAGHTTWEPPILWGHAKEGPFTILEGNKRLIACASNLASVQKLEVPCLIGLSSSPCAWHHPDARSPDAC